MIFLKNGKVTDSSYANIIFFDGIQWFTPSTFLLNGTCRQRLLNEGKITEAPIHYTDIRDFQQIGFINAMLDMGEFNLPISKLVNLKIWKLANEQIWKLANEQMSKWG